MLAAQPVCSPLKTYWVEGECSAPSTTSWPRHLTTLRLYFGSQWLNTTWSRHSRLSDCSWNSLAIRKRKEQHYALTLSKCKADHSRYLRGSFLLCSGGNTFLAKTTEGRTRRRPQKWNTIRITSWFLMITFKIYFNTENRKKHLWWAIFQIQSPSWGKTKVSSSIMVWTVKSSLYCISHTTFSPTDARLGLFLVCQQVLRHTQRLYL